MKFLSRFGCGCVGIDFGDGNQLILESCYGDEGKPALGLYFGPRIKFNNLPGTLVPDAAPRILAELKRLIALGRRFETLQKTLSGVEYLAQDPGWKTKKEKHGGKMKSGVEYLDASAVKDLSAQHPGWKTQTEAEKKKTGIVIGIDELSKILLRIDDALESPSEDLYHDTLYSLRDTLAELVEDPERMVE